MITNCYSCGTPLSGGVDTFASVHKPLCQSCWWRLIECTPKFATQNILTLDGAGNVVEVAIRRVLVSEENEEEYHRMGGT